MKIATDLFSPLRVLSIGVASWLISTPLAAQYGKAPADWPCVQRYVPELSAGVFWPGELPDAGTHQSNAELDELVEKISDPFSSLEDALAQVESFLGTSKDNKQKAASMLIAILNATTNRKRGRIIKGIGRFSQRQKMMLRRMEQQSADIERIKNQGGEAAKLDDLEIRQKWDIRVFEEREAMLNNLCEQPVLLEQRFFALGRHIANLYSEN